MSEEGAGPGFGTPQVTEDAGAWINDIAFSNGNVLAFTCQDATVRFKSLVGGRDAPVENIRRTQNLLNLLQPKIIQFCYL